MFAIEELNLTGGLRHVVSLVALPWPRWIIGMAFGVLLSLPSALMTKARVPILVVGAVGGLLIGLAFPYVVR